MSQQMDDLAAKVAGMDAAIARVVTVVADLKAAVDANAAAAVELAAVNAQAAALATQVDAQTGTLNGL